MSECKKGKKRSQESIEKTIASLIGRTHLEETKQKMSEARKRYWAQKQST